MKKSLIALAVTTISGAAFAQSSVTMFGLVDVGYGTHKTTGPSSASIKSSGVMDGANAGSRIGFRGTEDLGGGLKAEFWVEQGIAPTNDELFGVRAGAAGHQVDGFSAAGSAAALSGSAGAYTNGTNRQTYLGVISGMGTVRIGYQYTNLYELGTLSGYAMGSEGVPGADKAHLHMNAQAGGTRANAITYISPSFNGLTLRAQIGSGSAGRDTYEASAANAASNLSMDKAKRTSIMAKYDQGPLSAAVAYTANNFTASTRAAGAATTNAAERAAKLTQFGASYNLGVAKIGLTMNQGDNGGTTTSTANSSFKSNNWSLTVPLGAFVPFVSTGTAKTTNDSTNVVTEDYKMTQYGARYSLSKRTTAYVMAGTTKNNAAGAAWTKDSKTVVGLAHSF
jgi:predicted porin